MMREGGRTPARGHPPRLPNPRPYYVRGERASWYRRGERGVVVGGWPLWSPVFPWGFCLSARYCPYKAPTHPHHVPRPYYIRAEPASWYRRGERGVVVGGLALVVARPPY